MVIVQINLTCTIGSTGQICDSISKLLVEKGVENYIFYTYGGNSAHNPNYIKYGSLWYEKAQALKSRVLGNYGFNSNLATKFLLKKLDDIKPDIVHIHNIHGHDCNLEMLFHYLREKKIKVYYTFHDCWAFTGYCPHFTMAKCDNWLTGCGNCPLRHKFSWFVDNSSKNYERKKEALLGSDMTIVTPSQWLADITKQSFLKVYPVKVINNGIDLSVFKPTESDFRAKYGLSDKKIILGVAFGWGTAKGLDVFIKLSHKLPEDYQVVLVGTDDKVDKQLPSKIISIHRTHNQRELAEIYASSDVFVNATREDTYPTVNMEALACGIPVLTFRTGGSPEMLDDKTGIVVEANDIEATEKAIKDICEKKRCNDEEYIVAYSKKFDMKKRFAEYIELYANVLEE